MGGWLERRASRRRAGGRARAKYVEMRKAWLRRKRKWWLAVAVVMFVFWIVCDRALAWWPGDQSWYSGFVAGALFSMFIGVRMSPPVGIETWQDGAWGEEATAKQLAKLRAPEWTVLHDLPNGQYNFDHVVVGPPGVFCLNSKWSSYRLEADDAGGLVGVHRYDETITTNEQRKLGAAKFEAVALKNLIESRTGRRVWVQPVVVWWGDFPVGGKTVDGVAVVHGPQLVEKLLGLPDKHTQDVDAIIEVLRPGRHRRRRGVISATQQS